MKEHTLRYWINQLKPSIARQAMFYIRKHRGMYSNLSMTNKLNTKHQSFGDALAGAFSFKKTKQGQIYWWKIYTSPNNPEYFKKPIK